MLASKLFTLIEDALNVQPTAPNPDGTNLGTNPASTNADGNNFNGLTGRQFSGTQR